MNARHTDLSPAGASATAATTAAAAEFVKKWRGEQHSMVRRDYLIQICHSPVSGGDSCLNLPPSS